MAALAGIDNLLPHAGDARLLDRVVSHKPGELVAELTVRHGTAFSCPDGTMSPWVAAEIMAQTVSAYATASSGQSSCSPRIGLLLGIRDFLCSAELFPIGAKLRARIVEATRDEHGMAVFDCWLYEQDTVVAQAILTAYEPLDVRDFLARRAT